MAEIPINANDARSQWIAAAGQTIFAYEFPIFDEADIRVIQTDAITGLDTTLTLATDYTVQDVGEAAGGTITLVTGAPINDVITLNREVVVKRTTDFQTAGDFFSATLNRELDLFTMMMQEFARDLTRSLVLDPADPSIPVDALPRVRANKLLAFSASGQPIAVDPTDASSTAVTATGSSEARLLADRFADIVNVKDHGAAGDGAANDAAAVQAALDALVSQGGGALYFPAGNYLLGSLIAKTTAALDIAIIGEGVEVTKLTVPSSNTTGAIALTFTDKTSQVTVRDLSILADGKQLGTGLAITQPESGNRHNRTVYMNRVEIKGIDAAEDCFTNGLNLTGCWRPLLDGVIVGGPFGAHGTEDASPLYFATLGINLDDCYHPELDNCYVWSAVTGISCETSGVAEEEGFRMRNTNIVGVQTAFKWTRTGKEPTLWISNCHYNYRNDGLVIDGAKLVQIDNLVPYNIDTTPEYAGVPHDIHLKNVDGIKITGCFFHFAGNPNNRVGVFVDSATAAANALISDCFWTGDFDKAIQIGSAATDVVIINPKFLGTITTEIDDASNDVTVMEFATKGEMRIRNYVDGAASGPNFYLDRYSASPAASDAIGKYSWRALNSAAALTEFANMRGQINDPVDTIEDATVQLFAMIAGTLTNVFQAGFTGVKVEGTVARPFKLTDTLIMQGTATPEGAVTAPVGSLFMRTDGGAGTTLYVKESGAGNTGWAGV